MDTKRIAAMFVCAIVLLCIVGVVGFPIYILYLEGVTKTRNRQHQVTATVVDCGTHSCRVTYTFNGTTHTASVGGLYTPGAPITVYTTDGFPDKAHTEKTFLLSTEGLVVYYIVCGFIVALAVTGVYILVRAIRLLMTKDKPNTA